MTARLLAACLAAALGSAACAQQPMARPDLRDGSYALTQGATADLGKNVAITLDSVNDSRCPQGVMCISKGSLAYNFTLRANGGAEHFTLTPEKPSYAPSAAPGVSLAMDPGQPPEAVRPGDAAPAHNITLHVTRK